MIGYDARSASGETGAHGSAVAACGSIMHSGIAGGSGASYDSTGTDG
ncbi:hypothetical protein Corgl_0789 [Coriobacterium glomerans PW2]|uniref:Uncharacterized protein n=1 Tax=Coriobacterium glomerans (strain ATCC 49209 / DSM 20642 / JCM 10262 / PW2) TaxID=700015 RepID=F2NBU3_CORGP|nr:hypothetical protein Corgl_0789 [Coriobacterium glomerans PW2]